MTTLWAIVWIILGGSILIIGGDLFVRGGTKLAELFRVPPLVIGLTIVAIGTSAPELAVSLTGALTGGGNSDIAVGNVVGSNIGNILLILGISALMKPICVSARLVKREMPLLLAITVLFWIFGLCTAPNQAGEIVHLFPRWGGICFLILLAGYNIWVIRSVKQGDHPQQQEAIQTQYTNQQPNHFLRRLILSLILLAVGLGMILFGSSRFVTGAVALAKNIGISELVISLTILAVGTSLPELTVSLIASLKGKNDLAIGNVIGSNIFNLLGILGLVAVVKPGIVELSDAAFFIDIPILILVTLAAAFFCTTGRRLSRIEGGLLLIGYALYLGLLLTR